MRSRLALGGTVRDVNQRPLILLSNDDGIHAVGIDALARALELIADVVVVAPSSERSATSHSITLDRPLRLRQLSPGRFSVDGLPVDCVYIALHHKQLLPRKPDIVVSGINHGLNMGRDVYYSGTIAAAREATLRGIDAMAVSTVAEADFAAVAQVAATIAIELIRRARERGPGDTVALWNVNVPSVDPLKGVAITRVGERIYDDMVEVRADTRGRPYLWIGGPTVRHGPQEGTDTTAFDQGFVSLTPLTIDATHHREINELSKWLTIKL